MNKAKWIALLGSVVLALVVHSGAVSAEEYPCSMDCEEDEEYTGGGSGECYDYQNIYKDEDNDQTFDQDEDVKHAISGVSMPMSLPPLWSWEELSPSLDRRVSHSDWRSNFADAGGAHPTTGCM